MASLTIIHDLERRQMDAITAKRRVPEFAPGDTVKVMVKVIEDVEDAKDKKKGAAKKEEDKGPGFRLQAYEGVVIARSGGGLNESFTVRKISYGEGVERVFPVYSPYIAEIEVLRRGKVRRAKLYYLRGRRGNWRAGNRAWRGAPCRGAAPRSRRCRASTAETRAPLPRRRRSCAP